MKTHLSPRSCVAAFALFLGLVGSALAVPPESGARGPQPGHGMHAERGMIGPRDIARLHDELKLDAKQEALWQQAAKAFLEQANALREERRKQHDELLAQLKQPGADLRAIHQRMESHRAEGQKQRAAGYQRWLGVYEALNAEQKEQVRLFFKNRMERMGHAAAEGRRGARPGDNARSEAAARGPAAR